MHGLVLSAVAATAALSGSAILYSNLATKSTVDEIDRSAARELFDIFTEKFDKQYDSPAERERRFNIFYNNLDIIKAENEDDDDVKAAINQFADMSPEEFQSTLTFSYPLDTADLDFDSASATDFVNVDVKYGRSYPMTEEDKNCVFPARDQGQCGSCWAFATTAVTETATCKATGEKNDLAPQMLVDCDKAQAGCGGASNLHEPFSFIAKEGGLCLASDYPYRARNGVCQSSGCEKHGAVTGFQEISNQGADKLAEMIHKFGAVSVGIDGSAVQFYRGGVLTKSKCRARQLNHAVTAVGYEIDENGKGHFLIKNSWGGRWGESGHVRMEYGACFLGSMSVAPETA